MIELLQRFFIGHNHKWVVERNIDVQDVDKQIPTAQIVVLQCSICGCMKNHRIAA